MFRRNVKALQAALGEYVRAKEFIRNVPMNERESFFYDNAGWSYDPIVETEHEARKRGARELAQAELEYEVSGFHTVVEPDPDADGSWCLTEDERKEFEENAFRMIMYDPLGQIVNSLHGIDGSGKKSAVKNNIRLQRAEMFREVQTGINKYLCEELREAEKKQ
jgi:hypothetical protein